MKAIGLVFGGVLAALAAAPLHAAVDDYARQWPVVTAAQGAGAYRVLLRPDVYHSVQRADVRDLDIVDADGRAVPAAVSQQASGPVTRGHELPWYAMPTPERRTGADWQLIAEVDASGELRMLRSGAAASSGGSALLLDARGATGRPFAIELDWSPGAPFARGYRIEASDDLEHWVTVGAGRLVDLRQSGRRLLRQRIGIAGLSGVRQARFFRLVPEQDAPLPAITGVTMLTQVPARQQPAWLSLPPAEIADGAYAFESRGRFPVRWVDVDFRGHDARVWTLQSRDAPDAPWVTRVPDWMVFDIGTGTRSAPRRFDRPVRDRYWRLVPRAAGVGEPPVLRLGYRPEAVDFVAAGTGPYTLVAGSARAARAPAPVAEMLDAIRREQGPGWQPAIAVLGPLRDAAGRDALRPRRDWATWGLWAILGLGALLVAAFAVRLLREPAGDR